MTDKVSKAATRMAVRNYLGEIWRFRKYSIPALVLVSIGSIMVAYAPTLVVAAAIERFNTTVPSIDALVPYLLAFSGLWFGGELLWRASFMFLQRFEVRAMYHLYTTGLSDLGKKDINFFHNNFAGSLTKKTIGYGRNFEGFFDAIMFNIVAGGVPLIFAAYILWQFSPWLMITLIGMLTLTFLIVWPSILHRKKLTEIRETASNKMAGHIADVIGNMDAVQAFAHHEHEQKRHELNVKDYMDKALKSWDYHTMRVDLKISPLYVLINTMGLALAVLLSDDAQTMATIFVTFNYYAMATRILWEFNQIYRRVETAIAEGAQFTQLLLTPSQITEAEQPLPFEITEGAVSFRDVHFTYDSKEGRPLFADFNLDIRPGEKIALVGHSGGGKTTVTRLLLRFNDVTSGELLIDGQNVAKARLADIRSSIAYVPQEPSMFHRSIRDNIRYGRLDATDEEVVDAAKKANADEFISKLSQGYDTLVGERGVKLSGGQRQRIAIARAIIKNAPILVLDEATSALDSESEKLIQAALWELMKGRTAIVIAHRLSTIQKMDRIIVLDNGHIAEQGSHAELLKNNGTYAKLWAHQSGGFIEE